MFTRRDFIKTMSLLSGAVLAPVRWLGKWAGGPLAQAEEPPEVGELYAGFVLLPEGAELPEFVQMPKLPIPDVHDVPSEFASKTYYFATTEELAKFVDFPVYKLDLPSDIVRIESISVTSHFSGEVYEASIGYQVYNSITAQWDSRVSLHALPDYYKPYPLWFTEAVTLGETGTILEKVDFLPTSGINVPTDLGFVSHWIEQEILYTLTVEPLIMGQDVKQTAIFLVIE